MIGQNLHMCIKGVHRRTLLLSWSLFPQRCSAYLIRLILMVLEMGGWLLYSCCFVGRGFQDLFNIARCILMQFPSSFSPDTLCRYLSYVPPTGRVWHKAFLGGSKRRAVARISQAAPKMPRRHSPKNEHLRRHVKVRAWRTAP